MEDHPNEIARKAYSSLFSEPGSYLFNVIYSGRLRDYGAYVSLRGKIMEFKLSRKWHAISPEIQMGLMQELILKILKKKKSSIYIDLYNNFVRNLHIAIPKDKTDPVLEESFNRVNDRYFLGLVEQPNLVWGKFATTTFGSYNFKNDTITISRIFQESEPVYLDYIMFHETLHKQRKFFKSGTKTYYHDKRFKRLEQVFENSDKIEKSLGAVASRARARLGAEACFKKKSRNKFFEWF